MTPGPPPSHVVAILLLVAPLSQIPVDIYTPALPQMVIDLGLSGGMVSAGGYLIVSVSMVAIGALPERTQAPLGWLYVTSGVMALVLLMWATSARRTRVTARTNGYQ